MYIKSMVLDGFKSYAQRTEIKDFDPEFNAITGLNGSGKSNVLDGICFLLGISNLSHVRALNLNELVYKNGQAGVTKATVSITFDNSNKEQSPLGYIDADEITVTRQLTIGNRNKYFINGHTASNQRVQDLFRSVQLNINNPHFLIMQGRITKVLNMKPEEILSLVEEAAGTRLYENKKEVTHRVMKKKNDKLIELDKQILEELNPCLTKLKEDREAYLKYQEINRELDHLHKFYIAFKYYGQEKMLKNMNEKIDELKKSAVDLKEKIVQDDAEVVEVKKALENMEKNKDKEAGGRLEKMEKELEGSKLEEARVNSELTALVQSLQADEDKLKNLRTQIRKDDDSLLGKGKRMKELEAKLSGLEGDVKKKKEAQQEAIKNLQAVKLGSTSSDGGKSQSSVQEKLRSARTSISNAETLIKDTSFKLKHAKEDLKKQQAEMKQQDGSYKADQEGIKKLSSRISHLKKSLSGIEYSKEKEEELSMEHRKVEKVVFDLSSQVQSLEASLHQLELEYSDPERGFDRGALKGVVANLINLKDPKYATALETIAGGKLYQVVVDTEITAKKILEKGDLRKRVTFIPLNKINANTIHPSVIQTAKQLVGDDEVDGAMNLLTYEQQLHRAMAYVFGSSLVSSSLDAAVKVAFHEKVHKKTVTLDGNSFDPAGLASGGAPQKTESVLMKVSLLKQKRQQLQNQQSLLQQLDADLKRLQTLASKWSELTDQLDLATTELHMLQQKTKNSAYGQQVMEIQKLQQNIEEMGKMIEEAKKEKAENEERVEEFEGQLKDREGHMRRMVEVAEKEMVKGKRVVEEAVLQMEHMQEECRMLRLEVAELEKEQDEANETTSSLIAAIDSTKQAIKTLQATLTECQGKMRKCENRVREQKEVLIQFSREIEEKSSRLKQLHDALHDKKLKVEDLKHHQNQTEKVVKEISKQLEHMAQKEAWIEDEKTSFNKANSTYDFRSKDTERLEGQIKTLEEGRKRLLKDVNTRAMTMFEKAEEQYKDVLQKMPSVKEDHHRIETFINDLDLKKQQVIKQAVNKINKDFGSIFSTLLPGASAMLASIEEDGILKGVEFKVGFGGVWKESLTELSGGQRSLIALSLILSMLLFKPAPLYILDEVDAALDLSHTQNIGQMLRAHFKHSQFIIVSLKEGMFNNANVLFRTNFSDGVSSVIKLTQQTLASKGKGRK